MGAHRESPGRAPRAAGRRDPRYRGAASRRPDEPGPLFVLSDHGQPVGKPGHHGTMTGDDLVIGADHNRPICAHQHRSPRCSSAALNRRSGHSRTGQAVTLVTIAGHGCRAISADMYRKFFFGFASAGRAELATMCPAADKHRECGRKCSDQCPPTGYRTNSHLNHCRASRVWLSVAAGACLIR